MTGRLLVAMLVLGVLAASARGGGWATVELSSTPHGLPAGGVWNVEVRVMQHGRTPMIGERPRIVVTGIGGHTHEVRANATGEDGVYGARVPLPAQPGRYRYEVRTVFGARQYPPVRLEAPPAPAGPDWMLAALAALGAGGAAAGLVLLAGRWSGRGRVAVPAS